MRHIVIFSTLILGAVACSVPASFMSGSVPTDYVKYLPPGFESATFHLDDETSWYIQATYSKAPAGGFVSFFEDLAAKDDWGQPIFLEDGDDSSFFFDRSKDSLNVTVLEYLGNTQIMVSYYSLKWSHEEFEELAKNSITPKAKSLIDATIAVYASADSYKDTGTFVEYLDGEQYTNLKFRTAYEKEGPYFFEYADKGLGLGLSWSSMAWDGERVFVESSYGPDETYDNLTMAIAALYGVSSCTSGDVPELLVGDPSESIFRLVNVDTVENATTDSGVTCNRIEGEDIGGEKVTVWIDTETKFIRQIDRYSDKQNYGTTTYDPQIDVPLSESDLTEAQLN